MSLELSAHRVKDVMITCNPAKSLTSTGWIEIRIVTDEGTIEINVFPETKAKHEELCKRHAIPTAD